MAKFSTISRAAKGFKSVDYVPFSRVLAAFRRGPIKMQRDHATRALTVRHIGKVLKGDQLVFSLVLWEGKERLIDGYTRVERVMQNLTEAPDRVVALVHQNPGSEEALTELYDQFDSKASLKGTSCRYSEGLRMTELLGQMTSGLVTKGQKSAPKQATGAASIREGVLKAEKAMRYVDSLGLQRTHETLGMLAAYYAIALHSEQCGDKTGEFIRKMNQMVFVPKFGVKGDYAIEAARQLHQKKVSQKTATGGTNVAHIRSLVLGAFINHMNYERFLPSVSTQVTLTVFNEVLRRASGGK